jgi:mono/diheme cytochrome c family protein
MRNIFLLPAVAVLFTACVSQQQAITYSFPEAMAEPVRTEFTKVCDKGKILYDINCAGCHNIRKGKRQLIPDFTPEQLKGYELRVSNAQHEENMPDEKVTAEELSYISTFLLYKKKNNSTR